jgi:hypothetical protein
LSFSNTVFDDVGRAVELFLNEVRGVRSIDGFLVKLTKFVLRLEEVFKDDVGVSGVLEKEDIVEIIKNAIEKTVARGKLYRGSYVYFKGGRSIYNCY